MAFHRRQLSLYSSKKIVEVAPAVTQGEVHLDDVGGEGGFRFGRSLEDVFYIW